MLQLDNKPSFWFVYIVLCINESMCDNIVFTFYIYDVFLAEILVSLWKFFDSITFQHFLTIS